MKRETLASVFKIGAAVLLIAVLAFVIIYQNRNAELGSRIEIFKGDGEDSRGIEGYSLGRTAPFGDRALLVTTNTMLLLDAKGRSEAVDISLSDPEVSSGGKYILTYNQDGNLAVLYKGMDEVYEKHFDDPVISAVVNEKGYSAVACDGDGGETRISVYNDEGRAFYTWTLGSGQFVAMDLSADSTRLVISSINDDGEKLLGELSVVRLDSEEKEASASVEDEVYFKVRMNRDHSVLALGSSRLDAYNADGSLRWSLPYDGKTVRSADISDPDMTVLCYTSADSGLVGNSTEVEVVNRLGEVVSSTVFDGLCESLSVNGERFAASAGKKIFVFDKKCELKKELSSSASVKGLSLFSDGKTVFVLSGSGGSIIS